MNTDDGFLYRLSPDQLAELKRRTPNGFDPGDLWSLIGPKWDGNIGPRPERIVEPPADLPLDPFYSLYARYPR